MKMFTNCETGEEITLTRDRPLFVFAIYMPANAGLKYQSLFISSLLLSLYFKDDVRTALQINAKEIAFITGCNKGRDQKS